MSNKMKAKIIVGNEKGIYIDLGEVTTDFRKVEVCSEYIGGFTTMAKNLIESIKKEENKEEDKPDQE